ncbi:tRNA methyltransferase [Histoplasma capsulatum]|uniref:tRNA methyltransferase n=1 Tax=Ajellomyces capsulatus TaxID=5037 RepID=A0A8A1M695_AJECA|nr:tRNA methyltransferase [Histoplasma capsulatum]
MPFQHPFQCIQWLGDCAPGAPNFLVGAAGPRIYVLDGRTGHSLCVWPLNNEPQAKAANAKNADSHSKGDAEGSEPPEKRRKLSPEASQDIVSAEESKVQGAKVNGSMKAQDSRLAWETIPIVTASKSGKHIVVVSAEDKCIRVFAVNSNGALSQLSERCMPKRPCAVVLSSDESTILCGDKFGDVYSLPIFPTENHKPPPKKSAQLSQPLQPSASVLTVHTKRNLQALEQQLRVGAKIPTEKTGPTFELKLLLGHVSMLTDIAFVDLCIDPESAVSRPYIITADRDEHIRVSRGPPQCHIIQTYCLGHTAFVSRLCILPWNTSTLISGGGDDYILAWRWAEGKLMQKIPIPVDGIVMASNEDATATADRLSPPEIAVSGIYAMSFSDDFSMRVKAPGVVLVTLEGMPKLFPFSFSPDGKIVAQNPVHLSGNALGVTSIDNKGNIVVSVDNVHEPGSTTEQRKPSDAPQQLIQVFSVMWEQETFHWKEVDSDMAKEISNHGTFQLATSENEKEAKRNAQAIASSLYSVGNLRKWVKEGDE